MAKSGKASKKPSTARKGRAYDLTISRDSLTAAEKGVRTKWEKSAEFAAAQKELQEAEAMAAGDDGDSVDNVGASDSDDETGDGGLGSSPPHIAAEGNTDAMAQDGTDAHRGIDIDGLSQSGAGLRLTSSPPPAGEGDGGSRFDNVFARHSGEGDEPDRFDYNTLGPPVGIEEMQRMLDSALHDNLPSTQPPHPQSDEHSSETPAAGAMGPPPAPTTAANPGDLMEIDGDAQQGEGAMANDKPAAEGERPDGSRAYNKHMVEDPHREDMLKTMVKAARLKLQGGGKGGQNRGRARTTDARKKELMAKRMSQGKTDKSFQTRLIEEIRQDSLAQLAGYLGLYCTYQLFWLWGWEDLGLEAEPLSTIYTSVLKKFFVVLDSKQGKAVKFDKGRIMNHFHAYHQSVRALTFKDISKNEIPDNLPQDKVSIATVLAMVKILDRFTWLIDRQEVQTVAPNSGYWSTWRIEDVSRVFHFVTSARVEKVRRMKSATDGEPKAKWNMRSIPPNLVTDADLRNDGAGEGADDQSNFPEGKLGRKSFAAILREMDDDLLVKEQGLERKLKDEELEELMHESHRTAGSVLFAMAKASENPYFPGRARMTPEQRYDTMRDIAGAPQVRHSYQMSVKGLAASKAEAINEARRLQAAEAMNNEIAVADATNSAEDIAIAQRLRKGEEATVGVSLSSDERKKLLASNAKVSQSSLQTPSYEEACKHLGIKLPAPPKIPDDATEKETFDALHEYANPLVWNATRDDKEYPFRLKPHQVMGTSALHHIERSPYRGAVVADEMGLGKTITMLYHVFKMAELGAKLGYCPITKKKEFKPTLILAPVGSLAPWKSEIRRWFGQHLHLRIFYGDPRSVHAADKPSTLPTSANGLIQYIKENCPLDDPNTATHVIISSSATFTARTLWVPPKEEGDGKNIKSGRKPQEKPDGAEDEDDLPPSEGRNAKGMAKDLSYDDLADLSAEDRAEAGVYAEVDPNAARKFRLKDHVPSGMFKRIVIDEAHLIKGEHTQANHCVRLHAADSYICLTGTPLSRNLTEFAGILSIIWNGNLKDKIGALYERGQCVQGAGCYNKAGEKVKKVRAEEGIDGLLSSRKLAVFGPLFDPANYRATVGNYGPTPPEQAQAGAATLPAIAGLCMIRRTKGFKLVIAGHVITIGFDIPPPRISCSYLGMGGVQGSRYRQVHIEEVSKMHMPQKKNDAGDEGKKGPSGFNTRAHRRLALSSMNTHNDIFATHPEYTSGVFEKHKIDVDAGIAAMEHAQKRDMSLPPYMSDAYGVRAQVSCSVKKQYMIQKLFEWVEEPKRRAREMQSKAKEAEDERAEAPEEDVDLDDTDDEDATAAATQQPRRRAKPAAPKRISIPEPNKVILFVDWPINGQDICTTLATLGYKFYAIESSMDPPVRESTVEKFSTDDTPVLVASLRIAAQSLNLQAANKILFMDVPSSGGTAIQGFCRIWRIGAKENGEIEILITLDTVDMMIFAHMEQQYVVILAAAMGWEPSQAQLAQMAASYDEDSDELIRITEGKAADAIYANSVKQFKLIMGSRRSHMDWLNSNTFSHRWSKDWCDLDEEDRKAKLLAENERFKDDLMRCRGKIAANRDTFHADIQKILGLTAVDLKYIGDRKINVAAALRKMGVLPWADSPTEPQDKVPSSVKRKRQQEEQQAKVDSGVRKLGAPQADDTTGTPAKKQKGPAKTSTIPETPTRGPKTKSGTKRGTSKKSNEMVIEDDDDDEMMGVSNA